LIKEPPYTRNFGVSLMRVRVNPALCFMNEGATMLMMKQKAPAKGFSSEPLVTAGELLPTLAYIMASEERPVMAVPMKVAAFEGNPSR